MRRSLKSAGVERRVSKGPARHNHETMAFRSFELRDLRGIQLASATNVPNLAVIAGPNGSGKSTLLYRLYEARAQLAEPGTDVAYVGPHRSWRKSQPGLYALGEFRPSLTDYYVNLPYLCATQVQPAGMQGVRSLGRYGTLEAPMRSLVSSRRPY